MIHVTAAEFVPTQPATTDALEAHPLRPEYADLLEYLNCMEVVDERQIGSRPSTCWEVIRPTGSFQAEVSQGPLGHDSPAIVRLLGIAQSVHGSVEKVVHERLAAAFPDHTIITIGNNGINTKNTVDNATRKETASERHTFVRIFTDRTVPVRLLGTSLGGQTAHDFAEYNLDCEHPIRIDGLVYHASGKLPPETAKHIIDHEFIPNLATTTTTSLWQMGANAGIQSAQDLLHGGFSVLSRYKPVLELLSEAWHAGVTVTTRHDAILHHASMLRDGTSAGRIRRVTANHLMQVILYGDDTLTRGHNWGTLVDPDDIEYRPGGHNGVFSAEETSVALTSAVRRLLHKRASLDLAPAS